MLNLLLAYSVESSLKIEDLFIPGIVFSVGVFIFAIMMVIAVVQWAKVARARRWPVVLGTVLVSRVDESSDSEGGMQ